MVLPLPGSPARDCGLRQQRGRSAIVEPYQEVKVKACHLSPSHETMEFSQTVTMVLNQVKRLRDHMAAGSQNVELAKAAQLYSEIESLRREMDLGGVDVVEAELGWLAEVGQQIRSEAMKSLEQGMEALNQADMASVLQVYYTMGELRSAVDVLLSRQKVQAMRVIEAALDTKAVLASMGSDNMSGLGGISRSGTPVLGGGPCAQDAIWQSLQACIVALHNILVATWQLQNVLAKECDSSSHTSFLDMVVQEGEAMPTEKVWEAVVRTLTSQLKAAFTTSSFVKEIFVGGYPKLLAAVEGLLDRLARETDVKGVLPAVKFEDRALLTAALEPFQSAYLGQSLTRMTDSVNAMLPAGFQGSIPPVELAERLVARIQEEVEAVKADSRLTLMVLQGVCKALQLLAERAEYQVNLSPKSRQVSGPATPTQLRNSALCIFLQELHVRMLALLLQLPAGAQDALGGGLSAIHAVASNAITPLFSISSTTLTSPRDVDGQNCRKRKAMYSIDDPAYSSPWRTSSGPETPEEFETLTLPGLNDDFMSGVAEKQVSIGPGYQADLPGVTSPLATELDADEAEGYESDGDRETEEEEWLGTQIWPPAVVDAEPEDVGGARAELAGEVWKRGDDCGCSPLGSTECARRHVREADVRLKKELGEAYYAWGCDEMGEKYAASWTEKEEDAFVTTVQWYPRSRNGNFWDALKSTLALRSKREKVSYYFNVFVLRRRAAQNRLYPDAEIDSDDDEADLFEESDCGEEDDESDEVTGQEEGGSSLEVGAAGDSRLAGLDEAEGHSLCRVAEVRQEDEASISELEEEVEGRKKDFQGGERLEGQTSGLLGLTGSNHHYHPFYKKDDETDMEDTDDEHPVALDLRQKHILGLAAEKALLPPVKEAPVNGTQENGHINGSKCADPDVFLDLNLSAQLGEHGGPPDLGSLWSNELEADARLEGDRFISTSAVMEELFGDEAANGWKDEDDEHAD